MVSEVAKEGHRRRTRNYRERNFLRCLCMRLAVRARKINVPFNLTENDIIIPTHCPVFGFPLVRNNDRWQDNSPSVDRIKPELGYTKGNIIVVSAKANRIKSNVNPDEIAQVATFYKNLQEGQVKLDHIGLSGRDTTLTLVA